MKNIFVRNILGLALIALVGSYTSAVQAQGTETKQETKQEKKTEEHKGEQKHGEHKGEHKAEGEHKAGEAKKEEPPAPVTFTVAQGNIQFTSSGTWEVVQPRSRMLEKELKIARIGKDAQDGRLTIMGAGGSIEANILRWQGQFKQPDGSSTAAKTKTEKKMIADQTVNLVDITGTFIDAPGGPFSGKPKVEREGYRMLSAIIQTEANGNYFVKLYGPKATIDKNEEHFKSMINSLKVTQ